MFLNTIKNEKLKKQKHLRPGFIVFLRFWGVLLGGFFNANPAAFAVFQFRTFIYLPIALAITVLDWILLIVLSPLCSLVAEYGNMRFAIPYLYMALPITIFLKETLKRAVKVYRQSSSYFHVKVFSFHKALCQTSCFVNGIERFHLRVYQFS